MALFDLKLRENAFQTIPDISFFDEQAFESFVNFEGLFPPEGGSDWPETLPKRVSDDPRHFIFRYRKHSKNRFFANL